MGMTDSFKAHFPEYYGRTYAPKRPDYAKCCARVLGGAYSGSTQCVRKNGHGPDGAYCKQHDPDARKAKNAERDAKWQAERDEKARQADFARECQAAITAIADGHNDPRALAKDIVARLGPK